MNHRLQNYFFSFQKSTLRDYHHPTFERQRVHDPSLEPEVAVVHLAALGVHSPHHAGLEIHVARLRGGGSTL